MDSDDIPISVVLGGGSLLSQVARELRTALDNGFAPFGLTTQQAGLLLRAAREEVTPRQLAPELGTDTAGMTRLLDRLEHKGLTTRRRHPSDRRSVVIEVTEKGRKLLPRLGPVFGRVHRRLLAGFSEEEIQDLTTTLRRMHANLTG